MEDKAPEPYLSFPGTLQSKETELDFPLQGTKLDRVEPYRALFPY